MIETILRNIDKNKWIFAKSMPNDPHWYTLRKNWKSDKDFVDFVLFIREHGYKDIYKGREYIKFNINGYQYWTMGNSINQTTLINRTYINYLDYNIEYSHIYINEQFGEKQIKSIYKLKEIIKNINGTYQTFIMIDDYNFHNEKFNDVDLYNNLNRFGVKSDILVRESCFINANKILLKKLTGKIKINYEEYIKEKAKYPCSLFIASSYLTRLGHIYNDLNIKPAMKLINILSKEYEEVENKAREIIINFVDNVDFLKVIKNIYI